MTRREQSAEPTQKPTDDESIEVRFIKPDGTEDITDRLYLLGGGIISKVN